MKSAVILVASGVLAACAMAPPAPVLVDASDPAVGTRPVAYRPVVDNYVPRRPVNPEDWRERNRQIAPDGDDQ